MPEEFEAETAELRSQIEDYKAKISAQNELITRLKADRSSQPAQSSAETEHLRSQLEDYRSKIIEQNEMISRLRGALVSRPAPSGAETAQLKTRARAHIRVTIRFIPFS